MKLTFEKYQNYLCVLLGFAKIHAEEVSPQGRNQARNNQLIEGFCYEYVVYRAQILCCSPVPQTKMLPRNSFLAIFETNQNIQCGLLFSNDLEMYSQKYPLSRYCIFSMVTIHQSAMQYVHLQRPSKQLYFV